MKEKSELKKGVILSYIYLILNNVIQIIYSPFMIRKMGQAEYGIYSLCLSVVNYLTVLDFGLGNAIIKYVSENKNKSGEEKDRLNGLFLKVYSFLGLVVIIIGLIIIINAHNIFWKSLTITEIEKVRKILAILTINVAISLPLSVFSSIVIAYQKFIISKVLSIVRAVILPIIMIPLLINGYKSIAMSLVTSIIGILCGIITAIYAMLKLNVRISFKKVDINIIKEIVNFSIFAFILLIVDKINWNVDQVIIGIFIGSEAVAVYSVASHIFQMFLTFPSVLSGLLLPKLTEIKNNNDNINDVFLKTARIQLLVAVYISFGFILIGKEFIDFWVGIEYAEAYIVTVLLMLAATIPLSLNVANVILQAQNKQNFRAGVLFIVMITNIILSYYYCPKYGILGCTIGTVVTYVIGHVIIMGTYFAKTIKLNMKSYFKSAVKILSVSSFSCVCLYFIKTNININNTILEIIVNIIIYSIIFFILNYILVFNTYEKGITKNILKRVRRRND